MIGLSACLAGIACRYDGDDNKISELKEYFQQKQAVIVCPEVMGGMATPRTPAEIIGGDGFAVWQNQARVVDKQGVDVTAEFKAGAKQAYQALVAQKITTLILKENSPSCGSQQIYDGSFSGIKFKGVGVATAYFINQGMTVYSEKNYIGKIEEQVNGD